jgi:hypothetical protein
MKNRPPSNEISCAVFSRKFACAHENSRIRKRNIHHRDTEGTEKQTKRRFTQMVLNANFSIAPSDPAILIMLVRCHTPSKGLSNHLFALLPERLGVCRIERVSPHAFAGDGDDHVVRNHLADVTVLAVLAADLVGRRNNAGPY